MTAAAPRASWNEVDMGENLHGRREPSRCFAEGNGINPNPGACRSPSLLGDRDAVRVIAVASNERNAGSLAARSSRPSRVS